MEVFDRKGGVVYLLKEKPVKLVNWMLDEESRKTFVEYFSPVHLAKERVFKQFVNSYFVQVFSFRLKQHKPALVFPCFSQRLKLQDQ